MPIVKLDATSSTNDFLKEMSANQQLENFTVVTAENQTHGRGQMGAEWQSEVGKNLIMSVLVRNPVDSISEIYSFNICVAMAVFSALEKLRTPQLKIKWPNDIMSGRQKIGGILIENTFRSNHEIISIAGIGVNVNQSNFSKLTNATSLFNLFNKETDRDELREMILENLKRNVEKLRQNEFEPLWSNYISTLFKIGIPTAFEDAHGKFMGVITGVRKNGLLEIKLENDQLKTFNIKEVKMLY